MTRTYSRRAVLGALGGAALATGFSFSSGHPTFKEAAALTYISGTPEPANGQDHLLLRMEFIGGFVPVEYTLTAIPTFSLYADGRAITTGPMIEIFPQPALPNLRQINLTHAGIERVLAEARKAGLFDGSATYEGGPVADVPSTLFTLNAEGVSTVVSAYALGFDEKMIADKDVFDARAKLIALQDFLNNLPAELLPAEILSGDQPYVSDEIRVFARPIDAANPPWQDVIPAPDPIAWPLATPLANIGEPIENGPLGGGARCAAITGDDASTLMEALAGASQLTPWLSDETLFQLWVRPLLPDENGCATKS